MEDIQEKLKVALHERAKNTPAEWGKLMDRAADRIQVLEEDRNSEAAWARFWDSQFSRVEDEIHTLIREKCALEKELTRTRAVLKELKEALAELVDLVEDTRQGEYKPDSFTCQPAKAALDRAEREKGEG